MQTSRLRNFVMATVVASALVLTGCTSGNDHAPEGSVQSSVVEQPADSAPLPTMPEFDTSKEQQLLTGTWKYMVGAEQVGQTLRVHTTNSQVLLDPGATRPTADDYESNPPVNIYGTHVEMTGGADIGFAARLSNIDQAAALSFHTKPPVRYDENIQRLPGLDIQLDGTTASVTIYREVDDQNPATEHFSFEPNGAQADIVFAQSGNQLIFSVNGSQKVIDGTLFTDQVWFGMDTRGSFRLDDFNAYPIKSTELKMVDMSQVVFNGGQRSPGGLAGTAETNSHHQEVSVAVDMSQLMSNPKYAEYVVANFNTIELENSGKLQFWQPQKGQYEFGEIDALMDFAARHHMKVMGHALFFGEANPQWLYDELDNNLSPTEVSQLMDATFRPLLERYDGHHDHGVITDFDVINEPKDPEDWVHLNENNIWYRLGGAGWMAEAIKTIRSIRPDINVGINEYALETDPDAREGMKRNIMSLIAAGQKPNRIGLQAHFDEDTLGDDEAMDEFLDGDELPNFLQWLEDNGIQFSFSEISVAESTELGGEPNPEFQAKVYARLAELCLQFDNCVRLGYWNGSNTDDFRYFTGDAAMQDPGNDAMSYQQPDGMIVARPAYTAVIEKLRS